IPTLEGEKIAYLAVGSEQETAFQKALSRYLEADQYFLASDVDLKEMISLHEELRDYTRVIVGVHNLRLSAGVKNFGITAEINLFLKKLIQAVPTTVSVFGNVYSLDKMEGLEEAHGLLITFQENPLVQDVAAQIIFG